MKRIAFLVILSALAASIVRSQDAPRETGKVLLLKNERAFEGDVAKAGDVYRVRKEKAAGEIAVPASQVLRLCADWNEALAFMHSRANLDDPDERLRLAKWCQANRLIDRAREEAQHALELRPKHAETRQLVKLLAVAASAKSAKPASEHSVPPLPPIDLSFESVTAFTVRVQPILMNTCVNCHSGTYGGTFRLYRLHEGGERVATQRNVAAVIAQVHFERPAASPLLVMAVSAHGNAKVSPLPGRQSPTFQTLCGWLEQTLADNPQLRQRAVPAATPVSAMPPPAPLPASVPKAAAPLPRPELKGASVPPLPGVAGAQFAPNPDGSVPAQARSVLPAGPTPAPAPVAEVPADEFSAAHFNRWAHPERK